MARLDFCDCPGCSPRGELERLGDGEAERAQLLGALARVARAVVDRRVPLSSYGNALMRFVRTYGARLGLDPREPDESVPDFDELPGTERRAAVRELSRTLERMLEGHDGVAAGSKLDRRLDFLARATCLGDVDRALLGLRARTSLYNMWEALYDHIADANSLHAEACALLLGIAESKVYDAVSDTGRLILAGLAEADSDRNGAHIDLPDFVKKFLRSDARTEEQMISALFPVSPAPALAADDFAHMGADFARALRLLRHALASGDRANILFYGVPGTGKTELARLLAAEAGANAISIGEADDEGGEPTRHERLAHLRLSRKLVAQMSSAVLIIDEAEDLFLSGIESRGSKLWLNRLVEEGAGPHIWIVNEPGLLGEPVVRRMDMAVAFDVPPISARRRILERALQKPEAADLVARSGDPKRLADAFGRLDTTPAIVSSAVRTAARIGATEDEALLLARDLAKASGRRASEAVEATGPFDPALSRANVDLVALAGRLAASEANWSLLLSGPPGTGKSAFARHVAERAGIDLMCVSGSDLLGPFVGQTEENIAEAFARAERTRSLLLIDEADSFLASRGMAERNWEVSMTNEMLRQMERDKVRFIATTNRADTLDAASARRFTMHVEFAALSARQARALFEKTFGQPALPELDRISGLTPGDFAQARRRAALLGEERAGTLAAWLAETVLAREGARTKLGF